MRQRRGGGYPGTHLWCQGSRRSSSVLCPRTRELRARVLAPRSHHASGVATVEMNDGEIRSIQRPKQQRGEGVRKAIKRKRERLKGCQHGLLDQRSGESHVPPFGPKGQQHTALPRHDNEEESESDEQAQADTQMQTQTQAQMQLDEGRRGRRRWGCHVGGGR